LSIYLIVGLVFKENSNCFWGLKNWKWVWTL